MRSSLLIALFVSLGLSSFSQSWEAEGPFYGQSSKEPYMHSMGLGDAVIPHPTDTKTFLMATNSSGIWKTRDAGVTWNCKTDKVALIPGMGIKSMAINPTNKNEIIAGGGNYVYGFDSYAGGILRSTDWGDSWELVSSFDLIFKGKTVIKVLYAANGDLYVASERRVFLSKNNGASWKIIFRLEEDESYVTTRAQYLVDMEVSPEGLIFISSSHQWGARGNCWVSTNQGSTWKNLEETPTFKSIKDKHILMVKMSSFSNGNMMIGFNDGKEIALFKSKKNGNSFYPAGKIGLNWETGDAKPSKWEMEFSQVNPDKLYLGFIEFFEWDSIKGLRMKSPGPNISAFEHDDVRSMAVYSHNGIEKVLMGNDGGLSLYNPKESKFESLNGYNLPTLQVYNMAISQFDSNFTMLIGTQDNGSFEYYKGEWNFVSGGDGGGNFLSDDAQFKMKSQNNIIIANQGKYKKYFSPNSRFTSWYIDFPVEFAAVDSTILFGSARRGEANSPRLFLQKIKNRNEKGVEVKGMERIGEIAVSATNQNFMMVAEGEYIDKNNGTPKLMKTINRGKSFIDLTDAKVYPDRYIDIPKRGKDTITLREMLSYRTVTDIEIDPFDDNIIYISLSGFFKPESWTKSWEYYRVLISEDGGETWYDYSYGLPVTPIHTLLRDGRDEGMLFCGGDEGVYHKDRYNEEWEKYGKELPENVAVTDLKMNYCQYKLYCSTYGRGVFSVDLYSISDYTEITKDTEITTYQFVNRDIDVKRGVTLTITSDIVMGPAVEITLEPKSKLIIDGGSISRACSDEWAGIKIKEKKFLFFFKRKKGKVILTNGGTVND